VKELLLFVAIVVAESEVASESSSRGGILAFNQIRNESSSFIEYENKKEASC
jgi:hypothetical protein